MDIIFTEEQEMLRASARDFLEKECTESVIKEIEAGSLGYSPELWQKIADLGWLGLVYPEQYGGSEMNLIDLSVLCEEMGRASFSSPFISTVVLGGLTLLEAGSEEKKSALLPEIIEGNIIISPVLGESKSDTAGLPRTPENITITATTDGSEYIIDGARLFVHDANIAGKFLVPARTKGSGEPEDGITLFLIESQSPGISTARLATTAGDNQCEVIFNNVRVPTVNIIGELHGGWTPLSHSIQVGTVMFAAQMLGAGQKLLELSVIDYEDRLQAGTTLGVEEFNEEYLTNLRKDLENCHRTVYQTASRLAGGEPCDFEMDVVLGWGSYSA